MFSLLFKRKKENIAIVQTLKPGDILVDNEFGGEWVTIEIVKIGASGRRLLYKYLIVNGIKAVHNMCEGDVDFFLEEYIKIN
jgi:hypothetical protein